jgi:hypothetical protein
MQASSIAILAIASIAVLSGCASAETRRTADYKRNLELAKVARASGYSVVNRDGTVLFCRKSTPTGTNVPRSECHTPEDWDAINRHAVSSIEQDRVPFEVGIGGGGGRAQP